MEEENLAVAKFQAEEKQKEVDQKMSNYEKVECLLSVVSGKNASCTKPNGKSDGCPERQDGQSEKDWETACPYGRKTSAARQKRSVDHPLPSPPLILSARTGGLTLGQTCENGLFEG